MISVCIARDNIVHVYRDYRLWTDARGTPLLVARHGKKAALLTLARTD